MKNNWKNILFIILVLALIITLVIVFLNKGNLSENKIDQEEILNSTTTTMIINIDNKNNVTKTMENTNEKKTYTQAILHTNMGDIIFEFATDKPLTTGNFQKLTENGFYNGVKFHRVIKGFMIQTGDPLSKEDSQKAYWGTGGPGYKFADELTGAEKYEIGTVAMANSGPNTNGSQFFIMTSNTGLPPAYTVFGKVISGIEVAMKIQDVATDASDKPLTPITINSVDLK